MLTSVIKMIMIIQIIHYEEFLILLTEPLETFLDMYSAKPYFPIAESKEYILQG